MGDLPGRISLREVGPRDELQNEDPVPADAKIALVDRLSGTGVGRIEAVSFVSPKAIPQMADADDVWRRSTCISTTPGVPMIDAAAEAERIVGLGPAVAGAAGRPADPDDPGLTGLTGPAGLTGTLAKRERAHHRAGRRLTG